MNSHDLGRKVVRNTVAQVCGRNFIAFARLAIAGLIVRAWGKNTFGEYSLLFGILAISEWVLDFGTTEIFVRDVCRDRTRENDLLSTLAAAKFIQLPVAFALLALFLFGLRYPARIVEAGLVGGLSLVFYAGVLVYHTVFKADLAIHLEVTAELLSVVSMIAMVFFCSRFRLGLAALLGCHAASRGVFLALCAWFGRQRFQLSTARLYFRQVWPSLRTASSVGVIGFLVVAYEALDVLALSKLSTPGDLAYYSAAQRLIWPVVMALSSVGTTLYPLVASYWPHDRSGFEHASQRALNIVLLLAGAAACCAIAGAEFLMRLLGPEMAPGASALRILALLLMVKAVSATIGPVLYVLHAQKQALRFIVCAVAVKAALVVLAAPRYGYIGVATAAILVELLFAAIPSIAILQRRSGYQVQWGVPLRLLGVLAAAAGCVAWLIPGQGLFAGIAAGLIYTPFALLSGAVTLADFRLFLVRRAA